MSKHIEKRLQRFFEQARQLTSWRGCLTIGVLGALSALSLCATVGVISQTEQAQHYLHWANNAVQLIWSLATDQESTEPSAPVVNPITLEVEEQAPPLQSPDGFEDQISFLLEEQHQAVIERRRDLICDDSDLQRLMYYRELGNGECEVMASDPVQLWLILGMDESTQDNYHRSDIPILLSVNTDSGKIKKFDVDRSLVMALGLDHGSYGDTANLMTVTNLDTYRILGETDPLENAALTLGIALGRPVDVVFAADFEGYLDVMEQLMPAEGVEIYMAKKFGIDQPRAPLRLAYPENRSGLFPPGTYTLTPFDTLHIIRTRILVLENGEEWNRNAAERNKVAFDIGMQVVTERLAGDMSLLEMLTLINSTIEGSDNLWTTENTFPLRPVIDRMDRADMTKIEMAKLVLQAGSNLSSFGLVRAPINLLNGSYDGAKLREIVDSEVSNPDGQYDVLIGTQSRSRHFTMSMAPFWVNESGELVLDWSLLNGITSYEKALEDPDELERLRRYYSLLRYIVAQEIGQPSFVEEVVVVK